MCCIASIVNIVSCAVPLTDVSDKIEHIHHSLAMGNALKCGDKKGDPCTIPLHQMWRPDFNRRQCILTAHP